MASLKFLDPEMKLVARSFIQWLMTKLMQRTGVRSGIRFLERP